MCENYMHTLTVMGIKSSIFWDIMACSRRSQPAFLRLLPSSWSKSKQSSIYCIFQAGFLLSLLYGSEDGGNMFLENITWLSLDYIMLCPRR
jgi:hypothetical protein